MLKLFLWKDLRIEFRSREIFLPMTAFGLSIVLLYAFGFGSAEAGTIAPGLVWSVTLFVSAISFRRAFSHETDMDAFGALLASGVDRSTIFLGKVVSGCLFLLLAQGILFPIAFLLLDLPLPLDVPTAGAVILLTDLGIASVGSLLGGISMRLRLGELLMPILFFPLLTPLLIAGSECTSALLQGAPWLQYKQWFGVIVTFLVVFGVAGFVIFAQVTEE